MTVERHIAFIAFLMTLGAAFTKENLVLESLWKLQVDADGFESEVSDVLSTQARAGRSFQLIGDCIDLSNQFNEERIKVRLLEDRYECWFELNNLLGNALSLEYWEPNLLSQNQIHAGFCTPIFPHLLIKNPITSFYFLI